LVAGLLVVVALSGLYAYSAGERPPEEVPDGTENAVPHAILYLQWANETHIWTVQALLAGDITLLEAAAVFQELEALRPAELPHSYTYYPGRTVEEQLCQHVIQLVSVELRDERRRDTEVACLRDELHDLLNRGALRLPEPPASPACDPPLPLLWWQESEKVLHDAQQTLYPRGSAGVTGLSAARRAS